VQLEAMACGKPVVNTQIASGVPFASLNNVTGLTIEPCDAPALEHAVNRLLTDKELRARYGKAAIARVDDEFSSATMLRRTLDLYEQLLSRTLRGDQSHIRGAVAGNL